MGFNNILSLFQVVDSSSGSQGARKDEIGRSKSIPRKVLPPGCSVVASSSKGNRKYHNGFKNGGETSKEVLPANAKRARSDNNASNDLPHIKEVMGGANAKEALMDSNVSTMLKIAPVYGKRARLELDSSSSQDEGSPPIVKKVTPALLIEKVVPGKGVCRMFVVSEHTTYDDYITVR